jgi:hypothetical protein
MNGNIIKTATKLTTKKSYNFKMQMGGVFSSATLSLALKPRENR